MRFSHLCAIAALAVAGSAHAQVYVLGTVGATKLSADCAGLSSCDTSATGFKLVGGYKFSNGLAAEVGYYDFGKSTMAGTVGGVPFNGSLRPTGVGFGVAYNARLSPAWGATLRGGLMMMKTKVSGSVPGVGASSDSESNATGYFGVGLDYALTKNVRIEAGIDSSQAEYGGESGTVRSVNLGLRVDF